MARNIVGVAAEIPPGDRKVVTVKGRPVVIFNLSGQFFALLNKCPHQSADLSRGILSGISQADKPGDAQCSRSGEFIRCPWHGWEFDIRTGQSWCDPASIAIRRFPVSVEMGSALVKGPYQAERIPVSVEDEYLIIEM